jgi:hypothetical protein
MTLETGRLTHVRGLYGPVETYPNGHRDVDDAGPDPSDIGMAGFLVCAHPQCVKLRESIACARVCPQCGSRLNRLAGADGRTAGRLNTGCHACPYCEHVEPDVPRKVTR